MYFLLFSACALKESAQWFFVWHVLHFAKGCFRIKIILLLVLIQKKDQNLGENVKLGC